MLSPRSTIGTCALLLLALPAAGVAEPPPAGYAVRLWQTEDGLPQNAVSAVAQTRDGYIWVATYNGLARFDGDQFRVFDPINTPELEDGRITSLFEDGAGSLWIGHQSGLITRYRDGQFARFSLPNQNDPDEIRGIGSDEQGRLWALRAGGAIDSFDNGARLATLVPPNALGVIAWSRNGRGNLWVVQNGTAARVADGRLVPVRFDPPRDPDAVLCLAASSDGGAWVLRDDRIRKWAGDRWTEDLGGYPWAAGTIACFLELRDGTLAVGTTEDGLYLISRGGRGVAHFGRSNGLQQDWVRCLFEDREGNLWVGAGSAGLIEIRPTAFSVLNPPDQWQGRTVLSIAEGANGALWVGTEGAGLYHFDAGRWTHYGDAEGLGNPYIWAVAEASDGQVWLGNWTGGPYRLDQGRFVRPEHIDPVSGPILAMRADPKAGDVLVGASEGLFQISGNRAAWLVRTPSGMPGAVCAVERDAQGVIWVGFATRGLGRLSDGKLSIFRRTDGLGGDAVQCLLADRDGSLWIGTADGGLTRLKGGRFARIGVAQGLASNVVCHILDDGLGYLWLSTNRGIQRVRKQELNRCADGSIPAVSGRTYDKHDGLPTVEFTGGLQAAGCKTADGRLWFASSKGLVTVDPSRVRLNPSPPSVVVESLFVDTIGTPFPRGSVGRSLRPDHQRLEFRYAGLSFVSPSKVLFKYRLEGLDQDWVEAGSRRVAFYSQLPAGTYRFRVIACNDDGLWNTEGASVIFSVAPFFWHTWWFLGAGALLVLSGVAWAVRHLTRRRIRRRLEQLERQHAIERERSRIAQDIHDDLGASLTRIAMLSQPTQDQLDKPQQTAAVLSHIYSTARDVTRALDEIVWAVDPRHDTLDSLVGYMGKYAQDLLGSAGIRCRLDFPVDLPAWPITAEVRHNLFLAFKEALNNAVRHAAATEVRIALSLRSDAFVLMVGDNGRGLGTRPAGSSEPGRIAAGHGLANLERRLARIGGRCEISGGTGGGTNVALVVGVQTPRTPPAPPPDAPTKRAESQPVP